jgi:hypothetical protein
MKTSELKKRLSAQAAKDNVFFDDLDKKAKKCLKDLAALTALVKRGANKDEVHAAMVTFRNSL